MISLEMEIKNTGKFSANALVDTGAEVNLIR